MAIQIDIDDLLKMDLLQNLIYQVPLQPPIYPIPAIHRPITHSAARGLAQFGIITLDHSVFYVRTADVGYIPHQPMNVIHDNQGRRYELQNAIDLLAGEQQLLLIQRDEGDNLLAWWPLNHTKGRVAYDASQTHHLGNFAGADFDTYSIPGKFGRAFHASNGEAGFSANIVGTDLETMTHVSAYGWLYINSVDGTANFTLIDLSDSVSFVLTSSRTLRVTQLTDGTLGRWETNTALTLDTWHHIGMQYERASVANNPTFYVDGAPVANTETSTPTGNLDNTATTCSIATNAGVGFEYDVWLQDIRLYDSPLDGFQREILVAVGDLGG